MSCRQTQDKMMLYLDDLLDEAGYQTVRLHLAECAACQTYASNTGSLSYRVWELGNKKAPNDIAETILFRLKESRKETELKEQFSVNVPKPGRGLRLSGVAIAVAVLVIFSISLYLFYRVSRPHPKPVSVVTPVPSVAEYQPPPVFVGDPESWLTEEVKKILDQDHNHRANALLLPRLQKILNAYPIEARDFFFYQGLLKLKQLVEMDSKGISMYDELNLIYTQYSKFRSQGAGLKADTP